jgi:hypothetical protein
VAVDQKALAVVGARVRLAEIEAERSDLLAAFPALRIPARPGGTKNAAKPANTRKSSSWSPAQRKAVAVRMKKYWAARKAQETKKPAPKAR